MRNRILIIGAVAFLAYVLGSRSVTVEKTSSKRKLARRAKRLAEKATKRFR